jgi:hypothetical protein
MRGSKGTLHGQSKNVRTHAFAEISILGGVVLRIGCFINKMADVLLPKFQKGSLDLKHLSQPAAI